MVDVPVELVVVVIHACTHASTVERIYKYCGVTTSEATDTGIYI